MVVLFQGFYTCAWTNLIVTYPLELVTYQMRAKTWAFVLLTIQVASIFGGYVNPVGLENIGWKFYIYYCVWVAFVFVIVYFFFVETSGPTLEELAYLFEGKDGMTRNIQEVKEAKAEQEELEMKCVEDMKKECVFRREQSSILDAVIRDICSQACNCSHFDYLSTPR